MDKNFNVVQSANVRVKKVYVIGNAIFGIDADSGEPVSLAQLVVDAEPRPSVKRAVAVEGQTERKRPGRKPGVKNKASQPTVEQRPTSATALHIPSANSFDLLVPTSVQ